MTMLRVQGNPEDGAAGKVACQKCKTPLTDAYEQAIAIGAAWGPAPEFQMDPVAWLTNCPNCGAQHLVDIKMVDR